MPEPVSEQEIDQAIAVWEKLRPADEDPEYLVGRNEARAAQVRGLREFADLMESRPDLPMPPVRSMGIYLRGTAEERFAQIRYVGELLGEPPAPVYEGSDMWVVRRSFGPVKYSVTAYPPAEQQDGSAFAVGQAVQLTDDAAHVAETARLAQAGTVVGIEPAPDGICTYAVHFPGRVGTQRGWTESSLRAAPRFDPVTTSVGEVTSLQEAEELLIERGAEIKLQALSVRQPAEALLGDHYRLTEEVARACGLSGAELLRQIEPQVEEKVRGHVTAHGLEPPPTAAQLAASDEQHVTATVEDVPAQDDDQRPPRKPAISRARGKDR